MGVRPEAKWKQQYRATIEEMGDADLYQEVMDLIVEASHEDADDAREGWQYKRAREELERRLRGIGFL